MTRHAKPTRMLRPLNKRQWMKIAAVVAAAGLLGAAGLVSRSFYHFNIFNYSKINSLI